MKIFILALALSCSTPAIANERLFKLVARQATPSPKFEIKAGQQLSILSVLVNEYLRRDDVEVSVRYPGIPDPFLLGSGDHVSGPATVSLTYHRKTGREIAIAEMRWIFNVGTISVLNAEPVHSVSIQRSEDSATWSTIQTFDDASTNAFYRWKIEPRQ